MVQNNIWMRYLHLGAISLLLLISSCKKEWTQSAEYHFFNDTNHIIKFEKGLEAYNLNPKASIVILSTEEGTKFIDTKNYVVPLMILSKGNLNVQFDGDKCLDIAYDSDHSILNLNSYVNGGIIGKRTYKFTYTFTEADYNRAATCP